jgi:hypothetical protein
MNEGNEQKIKETYEWPKHMVLKTLIPLVIKENANNFSFFFVPIFLSNQQGF